MTNVGMLADTILSVAGVQLAAVGAEIRYKNRDDLVLIALADTTHTAAVFTQNAFCAAPVLVAKEHLARAVPRYLVINSGNANAGTGADGIERARRVCALVAKTAGVQPEEVLPFSTGVIGMALPIERFESAIPRVFQQLAPTHWSVAAHAIMTTDTQPKIASRRITLEGTDVFITGMAKGAGMICPNMATMLAFIGSDARIAHSLLHSLLQDAVAQTFNRITVDGDTSTNDACVLFATGVAAHPELISRDHPATQTFYAALLDLCQELALKIVRDAEGATKLVAVEVQGGRSVEECQALAYTVAHSPLVKTALFASDPNWGRILAAVGRAPIEALDVSRVDIHVDEVAIILGGTPAPSYTEAQGKLVFSRPQFSIRIGLGRGTATGCVWTCDLSHDYVKINAEYRS